ncbi:MAG: CocE/NonD family hydrolase [Solirubrobacterales bacterium]
MDWDVPIAMDDGIVLRADVYTPTAEAEYPVIASMGAYGKRPPFQDPPHARLGEQMCEKYPDAPHDSTNKYQALGGGRPREWVPHGYAVVRVDSRGAGRSEGKMTASPARETHTSSTASGGWSSSHGQMAKWDSPRSPTIRPPTAGCCHVCVQVGN